ncbi:TetR/AcrR family transcriptional regulator [Actinoplanes sp. TRM 88003]|uniref:TetR/AcrR family transcriptional regulator n=1 Tax=Paractinoplanes aksuensis TaxID=2939490 RepID=A0ABT1DW90_9ACTN|nr:TetR/AcrR family transcriptional regulator [Actinoplanes aksuensis]MCO8275131.1 TetR/AcrR family transcriptional regulator [Actinoplanes aksuensis]
MTRKDATRNWQHIVDTGRAFLDEDRPLRLNDIAREASIGVATVYRHFPTAEALLETLARPRLEQLVADAEIALRSDNDEWTAFADFLTAGINAQLADPAVQPVFAATTHELPETAELVTRLNTLTGELLAWVHAAGRIKPGIDHNDITRLMCGVVFAATVHAAPTERPALTRRYLDVALDGLSVRETDNKQRGSDRRGRRVRNG